MQPFEENIEIALEDFSTLETKGLTYDCVRGMAVTSMNFGFFDVTHIATGMKICGGFERMSNAVYAMLQLEYMTRQMGVGFDSFVTKIGGKEFFDKVKDKEVMMSNGCSKVAFQQAYNIQKDIGFEFPWEQKEDGPVYQCEQLLKEIESLIKTSD